MTTLSALDTRFACTCGGTSSAHSVGAGLVMRCEHCKECDGYRPARCVCHLTRDDGTKLPCYALLHEDKRDALATHSGLREVDPLYAAWYERQLAERPEGHAAHKRIRSLTKLWATCVECHDAKVKKLQTSTDVHIRERANVMAARRGIK